ILQRMRELAVQASSDTNTDADRGELQKELDELVTEIDRISTDTEFNTQKLLDGTGGEEGSFTFHIGANATQNITFEFGSMGSEELVVNEMDIETQEGADDAIKAIQSAIDDVSAERAKLGANQNRLEHTINNLGASSETLTAAESRIRDVDIAKEMMNFTNNNIITTATQDNLTY